MKIIRGDGKHFVLALGRERLPLVMPRKQKIDRLNTYQKNHGAEFACAYKEGGQTVIKFAQDAGFSLAECARENLGSKGRYIWTEQCPTQDGYIFVALDNGEILSETLLMEGEELDAVLLMQLFGTDERLPTIVSYGGLPEQLQSYLADAENDATYRDLNAALLDDLRPLKNYEFLPYQDVLAAETAAKGLSTKANVTIIAAVAAAAALGYMFLKGEESVVRVFDRYADYRNTYAQVTATPMLGEIYEVMKRAQRSPRWQFVRCEFAGDAQLVCELIPLPGARASELETLGGLLERPTQINLVENVAHAIITLVPDHPPRGRRHTMIVDRPSVVTALRDRLVQIARPQTLNVMKTARHDTWSQQGMAISKTETGLHFLGLVARCTTDLPVTLQEVIIEREEGEFTVSTTLQAYGAN